MRGADLIGTLPDEVLQHVLSFLPSRDAVHSSLLARRWRHLWRSAPAVRVSGKGEAFRLFVDNLLHHRNNASQLRSFQIDELVIGHPDYATALLSDDDDDGDGDDVGGDDDDDDVSDDDNDVSDDDDDDYYYYKEGEDDDIPRPSMEIDPSVDRWIAHALTTCRATLLTARFDEEIGVPWRPRNPDAFASQHLTTVHLELVELSGGLLDFSPCPALLNLTLRLCRLNGDALVSPSLERLSIMHCDIPIGRYTNGRTTTMRISTPSLRHLQISDAWDGEQTVPSLDTMCLLTTASIRLTGATRMYPGDHHDGCLLLNGLSEATTLELIGSTPYGGMEFLYRDLTWCPTFTKLKTLILNKWCVYNNITALACLLQHTPTLERLILRLDFESHDALEEKAEESYITSQHLFPTLENLKTVEIQRRYPYYATRDQEISKLFPRAKISTRISDN